MNLNSPFERPLHRATAIGLSLLALAPVAHAEKRHISVDEAVHLTLASDPRVQAAHACAEAAEDNAKSSRGHLLPSVRLTDDYQHWNSAYALGFPSIPGFTLPPGLAFPVRDQDTNSFVASADQPLVGLLKIGYDHASKSHGAEAAHAGAKVVEATLREAVEAEYLRYFAAKAAEDIGAASEKQLADQLAMAQVKLKAGVLTNADVLRIQVAVAGARQQQIQAQAQQAVSLGNLLSAMGVDEDPATIELDEPSSLLAGSDQPQPDVGGARSQALAGRPEVMQARRSADAAKSASRAATFALLPDVDVDGAYIRTDGAKFNPANAEFVGIRASWSIWEWGASYYAARAASAQARAAEAQVDAARRQVSLDVSTRLAQLRASRSAVDVATTSITAAEEAYRVMDALVKAGAATTTDLLDAQQALTQARLSLAQARYQEAIVRVSLRRAMASQ